MVKKDLIIVAVVMLLIWGSIFWYIVSYGESVTRDPCTICSEQHGTEVICTTQTFVPVNRVYYPNGSIYDDKDEIKVKRPLNEINFSKLIVPNVTE